MKANELLSGLGLPGRDLYHLPDSEKFPDGAQYRVEIPSVEGPRVLEAVSRRPREGKSRSTASLKGRGSCSSRTPRSWRCAIWRARPPLSSRSSSAPGLVGDRRDRCLRRRQGPRGPAPRPGPAAAALEDARRLSGPTRGTRRRRRTPRFRRTSKREENCPRTWS